MMSQNVNDAKARLDLIIRKARVDFYKPIQIAEVLHRSRTDGDVDPLNKATYQNPSLRWRNDVTRRLLGKVSTSSARYQHDVWNDSAMPPALLKSLDDENKRENGAVERYIYMRFKERQTLVSVITDVIATATPNEFQVSELFNLFKREAGIRRSIDKA